MKIKKPSSNRESLTVQQLEALTAYDFAKIKLTDEESAILRKINKRRKVEQQDRTVRIFAEQKPLVQELNENGFNVQRIGQITSMPAEYVRALPILIDHLQRPYSDATQATIARALAVRESKVFWSILVREFRKASTEVGIRAPGDTIKGELGAKDGLAVALSAACTDETLPELIALAKDSNHGSSRILLLSALKRHRKKSALVKDALALLVKDPQLKAEISSWKKL
jgi:hypothetical protein